VRLGDEFYLIADLPLPGNGHYGEYDQLGDGVGGAALITHEFKRLEKHLPARLDQPRRVTVVTGKAGERIMAPLVARLNQIENLEVTLRALPSPFWGPMISVTGLLTYQDVVGQLEGQDLGDGVIVSKVMLKDGSAVTLDGKTVPDMAEALGVPVEAVENSAYGLYEGVLGKPAPRQRVATYRYGNPYEPNSAVPLGALN